MDSELWGMIIKRLGFGLLTLFAISLLITVGVEFLAGDVCTEMLGQMAHPDTVAACRAELHLDRPVHIRYAEWFWESLAWGHGHFPRQQAGGVRADQQADWQHAIFGRGCRH